VLLNTVDDEDVYLYHDCVWQPMHRTISLDYGICIKGAVTLILDDEKEVTLREGDIIVQRGTVHAWRNASETEWARVVFVVLGEPLRHSYLGRCC
jgi:quercetin dioxygenase-like cupin family protein